MTETADYKPLNRHVLIELIEKTESGIYLPEGTQEGVNEDFYTLLAVADDITTNVKAGDRVNFSANSRPTKVIIGNRSYLLLKEHEILGKLIIHSNIVS